MERWSYSERVNEPGVYDILSGDGKLMATVRDQPSAFRIVAEANRKTPTLH